MLPQQYCLRWKHHHSNVQNMFAQLLEKERFCDVTLYCSPSFATQVPNKDTIDPQNIRGVSLRAHRVVLAACSELLGALLGAHEAQGEPVLVIDGAEPKHLKALLDYMYTGEMNVHHSQLASLLKTAEELRIKGLTDIRWNNKDEPPDCEPGVVATATPADSKQQEKQTDPKVAKQPSPKLASPKHASPKRVSTPRPIVDHIAAELRAFMKKEQEISENEIKQEKCNVNEQSYPTTKVSCTAELRTYKKTQRDISDNEINIEKLNANGGPPPLIKLPTKDKNSPTKRENSDSDSPSPKRQRFASGNEHTDDDSLTHIKSERDQEWQHGNLDISAERVVGWGGLGESSRDASDDEWADAPADIGSFLHTRLRVDGDNSADEESNESACGGAAAASSSSSAPSELHLSTTTHSHLSKPHLNDRRALEYERTCEAFGFNIARIEESATFVATVGPKSGPTDPRFTDVIKLSDYLQHGRRPQFWEEPYVKRVMEAVRVKELEMKQAAEILGVSYGTLYGRYRDVYGCINRPYRSIGGVREFWQSKGPSEVLEQLQRGDISLDAAARALGVSIANLAAHVADFGLPEKDFEPIPIEVDPSLKMRPRTYSVTAGPGPGAGAGNTTPGNTAAPTGKTTRKPVEKPIKKIVIGSLTDEDPIPATVITTHDAKFNLTNLPTTTTTTTCGKWPSIRVASLDTLRGDTTAPSPSPAPSPAPAQSPAPAPPSPCALMRTRPDLTIVAARKPDNKRDDDTT